MHRAVNQIGERVLRCADNIALPTPRCGGGSERSRGFDVVSAPLYLAAPLRPVFCFPSIGSLAHPRHTSRFVDRVCVRNGCARHVSERQSGRDREASEHRAGRARGLCGGAVGEPKSGAYTSFSGAAGFDRRISSPLSNARRPGAVSLARRSVLSGPAGCPPAARRAGPGWVGIGTFGTRSQLDHGSPGPRPSHGGACGYLSN